jgi:predicted amino acid dehydrogenase
LKFFDKNPSDVTLAVVGAYGIIGEAVSKILVPNFDYSILIGRKKNKLKELEEKVDGSFETTTQLKTKKADVIITATSHPTALLTSNHLKQNVIVVDVSQPPNLSMEVCQKRPDICRIDGGFVDLPIKYPFQIPRIPTGKIFSCVAEVIMQTMENERENHIGSIDMEHLQKIEKWAAKYGFTLNELTNFGKTID